MIAKLLTESLACKVLLFAQLSHFIYAVSYGEQRPIQIGDPLLWYLENYYQSILPLGTLTLPVIYSIFSQTQPEDKEVEFEQHPYTGLLPGLSDNLILDSNIWMNPSLDNFFSRLSRELHLNQLTLILFGPQFDEICNIKDRMPFVSKKGKLARLALSRVEQMQNSGLLNVQPIDFQSDKRAFADPKIVELISDFTASGKDVHFVTDDRELRIRARQYASENTGKLSVCDSKTLLKSNAATLSVA